MGSAAIAVSCNVRTGSFVEGYHVSETSTTFTFRAADSSETLVLIYQPTWCNIPGDSNLTRHELCKSKTAVYSRQPKWYFSSAYFKHFMLWWPMSELSLNLRCATCWTGKGRQRKLSMPTQSSSSSSTALRPFSWTRPPSILPPVTPVFCRSTSVFSTEQSGSVLPHFVTPSNYSSAFKRVFFFRDFLTEFVSEFCCLKSSIHDDMILRADPILEIVSFTSESP